VYFFDHCSVQSNLMRVKRSTWRYLVIPLIILVVLGVFFVFVDPREIVVQLVSADWRYLGGALIFLVAGYLIGAVRWRFLLENRPTYPQTLRSDSMSFLANVLLHVPSSVGRVLTITRISSVTIVQATSGMVVDRLLEQIMRVVCLVLTLVVYSRMLVSPTALAGNLFLVGLGVAFIFWVIRNPKPTIEWLGRWLGKLPRVSPKRIQTMLEDFIQGLRLVGNPARFGLVILFSVSMWGCFFVFQVLCLGALGLDLSFRQMAALALATLAVATPSAPAMPGIYHGIVIATLALLKILDGSSLAAYTILSHALQMIVWLPTGLWSFSTSDLRLSQLLPAHTPEPSVVGKRSGLSGSRNASDDQSG
jgi:glycosyltransferase 2 family protein